MHRIGYACILITFGTSALLNAQTCPPITVPPVGQTVSLLVTDGNHTCTVPDGGYIKVNTVYQRFVTATVTGSCQTQVLSGGKCVNSFPYTRYLGNTALLVDGGSQANVNGSPSQVQTYSTCTNPATCSQRTNTLVGGASWLTSTLGPHLYTSSTTATLTPCNLQPSTYTQDEAGGHSITMNVLSCAPQFNPDSYNHLIHLTTSGTVEIYADPAIFGTGISSALSDSIDAWNSALSGTGVTLHAASSSCSSGPQCVTIGVDPSLGSLCGQVPRTLMTDPITGVVQNPTINLGPNWSSYSDDGKRRTLMHEIGHLLGLDEYLSACGVSDAIMQNDFNCADQSVMHTITLNDSIPVTNTTYGGGPRAVCGF